MKHCTLFFGFILLFLFPFALHSQEVIVGDTLRTTTLEIPVQLDLQEIEIESRAITSPFLYTPHNLSLPTDQHVHSFSEAHRIVPLPTHIGITGFGLNALTNINRTALFSMETNRNLMFYFASTLGVIRTLQYGNINYYNIDVGAAFLLNNTLSGSAGLYYRNALQFHMPIRGGYLNLFHQVTDGLQLFGSATFQHVHFGHLGVNQHTLFLEGRMRQQLSDRWFLNAYGGTPMFENSGGLGIPMNPFLSTYYGASLEHWFNDNIGVEGGVVHTRNPFTGGMQRGARFGLHMGQQRRTTISVGR